MKVIAAIVLVGSTMSVAACSCGAKSHTLPDASGIMDGSTGSPDGGRKRCGRAPPRYRGPVCGPPDRPCTLETDEHIGSLAVRQGGPDLAIDREGRAHLLFSVGESGKQGIYAMSGTGEGEWVTEEIPPKMATGSLVIDGEGRATAIVSAGESWNTTAWRRSSGEWTKLEDLGAYVTKRPHVLRRSRNDCLYLAALRAYEDREFVPVWGIRSNSWSLSPVPLRRSSSSSTSEATPSLTLSPDGTPHFAYRKGESRALILVWWTPDDPPERVDIDRGDWDRRRRPLTVTRKGRVHLFYSNSTADGRGLVYARRVAPDEWVTQVTERHFEPQAAFSSATGEVRVVLTQGDLTSSPSPIFLGWPNAEGELEIEPLVSDAVTERVTAVLGPSGHIHLAFYSGGRFSATTVRYVRVGR